MSHPVIRSAYLATKDKLPDRFLFTGKLIRPDLPESFFFYLVEVLSPWFPSTKVQKCITDVLENQPLAASSPDTDFESIVLKINESLEGLAKKGEGEWQGNLNAILGLVWQNNIIITQTGNVLGYVFRRGKISNIIEKHSSPNLPLPGETFTEITDGKIATGDRIVFGNVEFYNHLALDRLRHLCENKASPEIVFVLLNFFKRLKTAKANAVIIEAHTPSDEKDILSSRPEILYLDDAPESFTAAAKKHFLPTLQQAWSKTRELSQKATGQSQKLARSSSQQWQKKYGPKTKEILAKGGTHLARATQRVSASLKPAARKSIERIKNSDHYRKVSLKVKPYTKTNGKPSSLGLALNLTQRALSTATLPRNRKFLYAGLIIVFIFAGYMKIRANNVERSVRNEARSIVDAYEKANSEYEAAREDLVLGRSGGRERLISALALAERASEHESNRAKAETLRRQIRTELDKTSATERFYNLAPKFSLGDNTVNITLVGSEIYGTNSEGKIFTADTRDTEARLVASLGRDNGQVVDSSYSESTGKIYFYTDQSKLLVYDTASKTFAEGKIGDEGGRWEPAKAIASYVTNLYLLDTTAGEVWKHIEREDGYSKGDDYVDTRKIGLSDAVDLAVDGNIYLLWPDATVRKYIKGSLQSDFSLSAVPENAIGEPGGLYTDADSNHLYVLDRKLNRIIRFGKNGEFANQYAVEGQTIEQFVVNTKIKKLWFLSQSKIYEIDL
ncbi:MAG: hypothetical protein AAB360_02235 [Patescibacteria group bacterium]